MLNFFKHKNKKKFDAGILGTFYFNTDGSVNTWDGLFKLDESGNSIELSIEAPTQEYPSSDRLKSMEEFLISFSQLKGRLLNHIYNAYQQSEYAFPAEQIDSMYFLAGVTLKENGDWWLVLEPGDVDSVHNHFMRFTVREGNIIWSNIY